MIFVASGPCIVPGGANVCESLSCMKGAPTAKLDYIIYQHNLTVCFFVRYLLYWLCARYGAHSQFTAPRIITPGEPRGPIISPSLTDPQAFLVILVHLCYSENERTTVCSQNSFSGEKG